MKKLFMSMAAVLFSLTVAAQDGPNVYFGLGAGFHSNKMKMDKLAEPYSSASEKTLSSGVMSAFVEIDFLKNHMLALRPQVSYLRRGGSLTDIGKKEWPKDATGKSLVEDSYYKVNSSFIDFRLPILFQFGNDESSVRPYIGVAPIAGFAAGGYIEGIVEGTDHLVEGFRLETNNTNFSSTYFAVAPMLGLKINFPVRGLANACFLGLEASYEIGLTNTYGKEKDGGANDILTGTKSNKLDGSRKFQGFEVCATVGIPLYISEPKVEPQPVPAPAPVIRPKPVVKKDEKPCYTLEEIDAMIDRHESVIGKTICAVDAINFDFNKATIKRESYPYLQSLAKTLTRTGAKIDVKGHTDNVGGDDYNMDLSKKRAKAVHDYLIRLGVNPNNLSYSYYGSTRPLTDNDTEEHRTMNRRVEFELMK